MYLLKFRVKLSHDSRYIISTSIFLNIKIAAADESIQIGAVACREGLWNSLLVLCSPYKLSPYLLLSLRREVSIGTNGSLPPRLIAAGEG